MMASFFIFCRTKNEAGGLLFWSYVIYYTCMLQATIALYITTR